MDMRITRASQDWEQSGNTENNEGEGITSFAFHKFHISNEWCSKEDSNLHRFPY